MFMDFHAHTHLSDGALSPQQLLDGMRAAGIGVAAITDHNYTEDLTPLRSANPDLHLVQGAEISCIYTDPRGQERELHVVGLGFDPEHEQIKAVLTQNQPDRRPYINAILQRLREVGVELCSYEELQAKFPETHHLGRKQVADTMVEAGYVSTVDEAFDLYIGKYGEKRAYVKSPLRYVSLEQAVSAILAAGGVAVLCHLFYYQLGEQGNEELTAYFRTLTGERGGLEVYYYRYDGQQRDYLLRLSRKHGLMPSAASDYHGANETLEHHFCCEDCAELLTALGLESVLS